MAFCFSGLFCPRGVLLESALSGSFQHLVALDTVGIYIHTWFMMSPYFLRKYESTYIVLYFLSYLHLLVLKGPKHEIFESGFFTEIRPVRIGDLGTGEKK